MYIRFVVPEKDEDSGLERGVYTALYALEDRGELAPYELEWFHEADRWLSKHLKRPTRFAWSSRPHAPERAISWLKDTATDHVSRMRSLVALLEYKHVFVAEFRTDRPGYIVYEDEHQVVAIPFQGETF